MLHCTPLTGGMYGLTVRSRGAGGDSRDEVINERVREERPPGGSHEMASKQH